ncbi:putative ribonuclease H-like domain-containing protein, partial [Tanacetum coccineum]
AEAIATACYTQNRSLIHTRHNKTPYELVHDKKPDLKFFQVFGSLCYPTNDSEDHGKLKATTDIRIFIDYAPNRKGYRIYNKITRRIMETIHIQFDELSEPMARSKSGPWSSLCAPTNKDLDILFQPMFDEYFEPPGVARPVPPAPAAQVPILSAGTPSSTTIDHYAPSTSHSLPSFKVLPPIIHQEPSSEESSSRDGCSAKSNQVIQPYNHLRKWPKDYLMDNVIGNPSRPISTRKQLATDALWCFYNYVLLKVEPKNFKTVLVPKPDYVMIIALKWIYKVKLDEYGDVLKNKPRLVAKGYHQEEGINFEESFAPVPRAWYNTLSRFLLANKFSKGVVDPTYQAKPTKKHLEAIKRVLRFLPWRESFGGDNDEELEMEPRPEQTREVTPPLRTRSPRVHRQRERVVGFEEAPNREISRIGRNIEGNGPSEAGAEENGRREMNLPLLLVAHLGRNEDGQPSRSSLTSVHRGRQSSIFIGGNLPPNDTLLSHHAQPFIPNSVPIPNGFLRLVIPLLEEPLPTLHKEDPTGSVTPFVRWIENYPLLDGLKFPSHVGSYDEKGDPDNFLHLFEGAIRMQKWLMLVACHMFTYTLKDSARIWWNSQKAGSILNYEDLKAKFRSHFFQQKRFIKTHLAVHSIKQREGKSIRALAIRYTDDTLHILGLHEDQCISGFVHDLKARNLVEHLSTNLPSTYKGLMEKTYTWIEAREVSINGAPNDRRDNFERSRKPSWNNGRGQRSRDRFSPYQGPNHGLLSSLSKSPREILVTKKVAKTFEQPPWLPEKERKKVKPAETYVLIIRRISCNPRKRYAEEDYNKVGEITFPLVTKDESSADPVIIKAYVSRRQVNRVYMDSGSSCEVIYEHCFLKLKPSIRSLRVDSKTPLVVNHRWGNVWPWGVL